MAASGEDAAPPPLSGGPNVSGLGVAEGANRGADVRVLQYIDFRDFLWHLGIDPRVDASGLVMVAAHHMFAAPLPPHWSEQFDEGSRVYFHNSTTDESLWGHPHEKMFKELVAELETWRPDEPLADVYQKCDAHLRKAQKQASEAISQWTSHDAPKGPEEAPENGDGAAAQFYFNNSTGESRWEDPRESVEFDLRQRHAILCECIVTHTQTLAKMLPQTSTRSSESSDGETDAPSVQALVQSLWQSLGTLPLPARQSEMPDAPLPAADRRPAHLPSSGGDDTVRSSLSYLTARSTASCLEGPGGTAA
mmetsp:Transcript_60501/g.155915  ORF Transcript_60501/g.155915 Transcript_60501/m.155915 type:complete len:307 (-) Transcript_60501:51-971(-)